MKCAKVVSSVVVLILVCMLSLGVAYAQSADDSAFYWEENAYYADEEIFLEGDLYYSLGFDFQGQLDVGNKIFIYNTRGALYDFYMDRELENTYALVYYFGSDGILNRKTLKLNSNNKSTAYVKDKIGEFFKDVKNSLQAAQVDGWAIKTDVESDYVLVLKNTTVSEHAPHGYMTVDYNVYRAVSDDAYFYKVETGFRFVPGSKAFLIDRNYNPRRYNGEMAITLKGNPNTEQSSDALVPKDYWPKHDIPSGAETNWYGLKDDGKIEEDGLVQSSLGTWFGLLLPYYYQDSYTVSTSLMSAQFLPNLIGASWVCFDFSGLATSEDYNINTGIIFERVITDNAALGDIEINAKYTVWGLFGIRYRMDFNEIINLK